MFHTGGEGVETHWEVVSFASSFCIFVACNIHYCLCPFINDCKRMINIFETLIVRLYA
jgi:hypothetical protein